MFKRSVYFSIALMLFLAVPGMAQTPPWTIGDIKFTGLFDGYYQWNNNHPASGNTTLRNFEVSANSFALNMVELSATHDAEPIGFRLDLGFGRAWEIFNSFDSTKTTDKTRYVQQAFVSISVRSIESESAMRLEPPLPLSLEGMFG